MHEIQFSLAQYSILQSKQLLLFVFEKKYFGRLFVMKALYNSIAMKTQILLLTLFLLLFAGSSSASDFSFEQEHAVNKQSISVFPNPVKDKGTLKITLEQQSDVVVEFYDLTGKKIKELKLNEVDKGKMMLEFNTAGMNDGIYICQVKTNRWVKAKRIVVKQR